MIYSKKLLLKVVKLTEFRKAEQKFQTCIPKKIFKAKIASHVRDMRGALRNISMIPDYLLRRIFRLDKETFAAVLLLIYPLLAKDIEKATLNGSGGETINQKLCYWPLLDFWRRHEVGYLPVFRHWFWEFLG